MIEHLLVARPTITRAALFQPRQGLLTRSTRCRPPAAARGAFLGQHAAGDQCHPASATTTRTVTSVCTARVPVKRTSLEQFSRPRSWA
ncbi:hypothetical protein DSL92_08620 [Billgrantia gudaonensis]|uniref:Uncharacterized protein n=1 Tax=Billgrantia gudaonensis TaxID=376427 RepID=A0A432JGN4_9GAMM|nr:hypothetical protein DSL92_08620 [Halomonas gudaonensis]